jgi:hypothetical protein
MHTADVKAIYKTEIKPENYTLHHFVQGIVWPYKFMFWPAIAAWQKKWYYIDLYK